MAEPKLVVLVEDSATQAEAIAMYLNACGVNVAIAPDGPDGLWAIAEYEPAAVILDINLPTMTGYQVCSRLKRDPATANIPIIMLTKLNKTSNLTHGLNCGADHYIPKGAEAAEELRKTLCGFGIISW